MIFEETLQKLSVLPLTESAERIYGFSHDHPIYYFLLSLLAWRKIRGNLSYIRRRFGDDLSESLMNVFSSIEAFGHAFFNPFAVMLPSDDGMAQPKERLQLFAKIKIFTFRPEKSGKGKNIKNDD